MEKIDQQRAKWMEAIKTGNIEIFGTVGIIDFNWKISMTDSASLPNGSFDEPMLATLQAQAFHDGRICVFGALTVPRRDGVRDGNAERQLYFERNINVRPHETS